MNDYWVHAGTFKPREAGPLKGFAQRVGGFYLSPQDRQKCALVVSEEIHAGAARYVEAFYQPGVQMPKPLFRFGIDIEVDPRAARVVDAFVPKTDPTARAKLERILRSVGMQKMSA